MNRPILVTGSGALNLDIIYQVPSLKGIGVGGRPLLPGREFWGDRRDAGLILEQLHERGRLVAREGGGSSANTITVLARLGARFGIETAFIGSVGDDPEGDYLLDSMQGVDLSGVVRRGNTSICIVVLDDETMDRAMFVAPGEISIDFDSKSLQGIVEETGLLHFSSLARADGPAMQKALLDMTNPAAIISSDPGEVYTSRGLGAIRPLLEMSHLLFSTDEEERMLFEQAPDPASPLDILRSPHGHIDLMDRLAIELPVYVRKQGRLGAGLQTPGEELFLPALKVPEIVDNTGAGDAFDAGFLLGLMIGRNGKAALELGHRVAALSLSGYGRQWMESLEDFDV